MTTLLRKLGAVGTAMMIGPVFAQIGPPQMPFADMPWEALSKTKPASHLRMGNLEVRFEETTLRTIADTAGSGTMDHRGDAGDSIYWLCYTIPAESMTQRIWLVAHGEMGGPDHAVTTVTAQELSSSAQPTSECPTLPSTLQPVSLPDNVWLGVPQSEALKMLGRPSYRKGSWRSFNYQGKVPGNCQPDGFDLMNWVQYGTSRGRIVIISAGQVTSC